MASLQDQLIKAGLVNKHKAKLLDKEKQKQANLARKSGAKKSANKTKSAAQQQRQRRIERDRELNRERQEASKRKEVVSQVKQLIAVNKQDRSQGEIPYRFVFKNKVKNILVTSEQRMQLTNGLLAIVVTGTNKTEKFEIVTPQVAQKITERDARSVVPLDEQTGATSSVDDLYAEYQVPDDLIW